MQPLEIPGFGTLTIENLILDFNGTLALDGKLLDGIPRRIDYLARAMSVYVLTADTHGYVEKEMRSLPCTVEIVPSRAREGEPQLAFITTLGPGSCAAIGNGAIDALMLDAARLGICIIGREGASGASVRAADIIMTDPLDALDLFINPARLVASLRY